MSHNEQDRRNNYQTERQNTKSPEPKQQRENTLRQNQKAEPEGHAEL